MTPKENYARALQELLNAQKEVTQDHTNPFDFGLPTHLGLSDDTFISDDDLEKLSNIIEEATTDNKKFAKIWNLGTDLLVKAKGIFL